VYVWTFCVEGKRYICVCVVGRCIVWLYSVDFLCGSEKCFSLGMILSVCNNPKYAYWKDFMFSQIIQIFCYFGCLVS
jgi:hypothetical protein